MPNRARNFGMSRLFQFGFACLVAILLASMLFANNNVLFLFYARYFWPFLFAVIVLFGLFFWALGKLRASRFLPGIRKNWPWLLAAFMVALTVLQVIVALATALPLGWDIGVLAQAAANPHGPFSSYYFSIYPNNLFLLMVYRVLWRLTNLLGLEFWGGLAVANIAAINAALVAMVIFVQRKLGLKLAASALVLGTCLFGLSPWMVVLYSDTFAMPFLAGALLLYDVSAQTKNTRVRVFAAVLMGIFVAVGTLIKPTVVIFPIAIALAILARHCQKLRLLFTRQNLLRAAAFATAAVCTSLVCEVYMSRQKFIALQPGIATPMAYFMLIGLQERYGLSGEVVLYGTWNEEDYTLISGLPSTQEKTRVSLEHIAQRWQARGLAGTLHYYFDKLRWFTSDGTFFWGQEGTFMDYSRIRDTVFSKFFYSVSPHYPYLVSWMQAVWAFVWMLLLASAYVGKKHRAPKELVILQLAIAGILLFITLFEGRSRYLLLYMPVFMAVAAYGLGNVQRAIHGWRSRLHGAKR